MASKSMKVSCSEFKGKRRKKKCLRIFQVEEEVASGCGCSSDVRCTTFFPIFTLGCSSIHTKFVIWLIACVLTPQCRSAGLDSTFQCADNWHFAVTPHLIVSENLNQLRFAEQVAARWRWGRQRVRRGGQERGRILLEKSEKII
jgi:hypothetical protein